MVSLNRVVIASLLFAGMSIGCNESIVFEETVDNCLSDQKLENGVCVDIKCGTNQKIENGECVDIKCGTNQKFENGECVDIKCGTNQKFENGECVDIKCGTNQKIENGECVDIKCGTNQKIENGECVDINGPIDPCEGKVCPQGTCSEGVCVTSEMRAVQADTPCDPETFVEFCDGKQTVYCDQGIVAKSPCASACAVYMESYHGVVKLQSGCIDTDYNNGECTELDALESMCDDTTNTTPAVLVSACQRTTRNQLKWISVNGYYCKGRCDSAHKKCELAENECDPYDKSNYKCDRRNLTYCYLDSNLQASIRTSYCAEACITMNGIAMCGYTCETAGERKQRCVNADSTEVKDSGVFICREAEDSKLYSVWNGDYDLCETECDVSTGECKP